MIEERMVYTVNEVCKLFSIAQSTFWLWSRNGKFRLIRIGHRTYVPASEVKRLVNGDKL